MVSGSYWAVGAGGTVFTAPDQELQLRYGDENVRAQEMGPEQVALPTAQGSAEFWSDRGSVAAPSFRVPAPYHHRLPLSVQGTGPSMSPFPGLFPTVQQSCLPPWDDLLLCSQVYGGSRPHSPPAATLAGSSFYLGPLDSRW